MSGTLTTINSTSSGSNSTGGVGGLGQSGTGGASGNSDATPVFNYGGTVNGSSVTGPIADAFSYFVVETTLDDGSGVAANCPQGGGGTSCTLRDALAAVTSAGGGKISFDSAVFKATNTAAQNTIQLSSALTLPSNTTIQGLTSGSGATLTNLVTVSGQNTTNLFTVGGGVTGASIANLNLANGNTLLSQGGAIYMTGGALTVSGSTFSGSTTGDYGQGGAIYAHSATLTLDSSTFNGNTAGTAGQGGAIYLNSSTATISNCTFSSNTVAGGQGGAIFSALGTVTISRNTFSGNSAGAGGIGGALFNDAISPSMSSTILAGNSAGSDPDAYGTFTDGGRNLIGDGSGTSGISNGTNGNLVGTSGSPINPVLGTLGNYGGPTQTMIPLPGLNGASGSPAICAGSTSGITSGTTDSRGFPRTNTTYIGYSAGSPCVDIGAVQTNYQSVQFNDASFSGQTGSSISSPAVPVVSITENGQNLGGLPLTLNVTSGPASNLSGLGPVTTVGGTGAAFGSLQASAAGSYTVGLTLAVVGADSITASADLIVTEGAPTLTSIGTSTGPITGGTTVLITGTNFTGATSVRFGGIAATSFTVNSASLIAAISPSGPAGTVDITVTTSVATSAKSAADQFTFFLPSGSYSCAAPNVLQTFTNSSIAGTTTGTIQSFTVPSNWVIIDALGAQGGTGANGGGKGAEVVTAASITPGQTLCVLPGVQGGNYGSGGAGGGGGSFVYAISSGTCASNLASISTSNLLVAAGGGGGSGNSTAGLDGLAPVGAATAGASAGSAGDQSGGAGGTGGNGGGAITNSGGGGGLLTGGAWANGVPGGSSLLAGASGGSGYGSGGFGGGGAGSDTGGGGGGFNGGGAGGINPLVGGGGGGGGSYSIGAPLSPYTKSGINSGNGFVTLCYLQQAAHFSVSAPASVVSYTNNQLTVTALDANGNVVAGYSGTVHLTSTDPGFADITGDATLTNGVGVFNFGLKTAGPQTITATDTVNASITGTSNTITVLPGAATHFGVSAPASAYAGGSFQFTVAAYDLYNNLATGYTGTVHFTSTDGSATLPADSTLTNGAGTFRATLLTSGAQTISAIDTVSSSITGISGNISVSIPNYVVTTVADDVGTAGNCTAQTTPGAGSDASCSLRDALLAAASAGSGNITFDSTKFATAQTITLSSGTLPIRSNTSISGPTVGSRATLTNLVTVSGNNAFTVFTVSGGVTGVVINNLNIANGSGSSHYFAGGAANSGGGIFNAGTLTLRTSTISANTSSGSGAAGGAIENIGTLAISNSTVTGNSAPYGGGIDNNFRLTVTDSTFSANSATHGGGIENEPGASLLTIINSTFSGNSATDGGGLGTTLGHASVSVASSTFSGNSATGLGGGILNEDTPATVINCTISGNSAPAGGGIENYGTLTLANNIIFGNSGGDESGGGSSTDNGGNVIGNSSIQLAPLGNYGGTTETMIPLPGSAGICAGFSSQVPAGATTDQRGVAFGAGGYCPSGSVDAGAVQTDYALSFSTQPTPISPASSILAATNFQAAVTLNENGGAFTAAAESIPLSLTGNGSLTGGSANTSSGIASYSALQISASGSADTLTANLALNAALTPALAISATSSPFSVIQATPTLGFVPSVASQTYGAAITAAALNANASYNSATVAGTFAYTTTMNGNTVALIAGTTILPVGNYTITAAFTPASSSYRSASTTAGYSVSPAALSITASGGSMTYGGAVPTITPTYSGFVNGDTSASLRAQPTCSTTATSTSPVGPYPSTCSGAADPNYTITYLAGTEVVSKASLAITAKNASRLFGQANPAFSGTVSGAQNGDTFTESFTTSAVTSSPVGNYSIIPSVAGIHVADYLQTVSNGALTVSQAPSVTNLKASSASVTPGQSITLTATVATTTSGTPTGTVNFYDNGALLNSTPAALNAGVTSYSTTSLAADVTHDLTATYSGDVNFLASTSGSAPVVVPVAALDFTMTLMGPSNLTVIPGQSISYQVQVKPEYGSYAGTVDFAVSGLPPGATAAFSPSSIAANGGPQTVTITITTAPATAMNREQPTSGGRRLAPIALGFLLLFGMTTLRKRSKALRRLLCVLALLGGIAATTAVSGCGAKAGFFAQAPQSYTITTTATAANLQHSTTFTLNVQ